MFDTVCGEQDSIYEMEVDTYSFMRSRLDIPLSMSTDAASELSRILVFLIRQSAIRSGKIKHRIESMLTMLWKERAACSAPFSFVIFLAISFTASCTSVPRAMVILSARVSSVILLNG